MIVVAPRAVVGAVEPEDAAERTVGGPPEQVAPLLRAVVATALKGRRGKLNTTTHKDC